MKPIKGWVVVDNNNMLWWTFDPIQKYSGWNMFDDYGKEDEDAAKCWKRLKQQGFRCIRVTLRADE